LDFLTALALGLVQGLTEFLPVSSSGHLVLAQSLFGFREPQLLFDIVLHLGTLAAVVIFVRKELAELIRTACSRVWLKPLKAWRENPSFRLLILIVIGCLPTALIGAVFKDWLTSLFASTRAVGFALMATGFFLAATRLMGSDKTGRSLPRPWEALAVGAAQGLAIIPGLSRSGATIAAGLFFGLDRAQAARFSFLLFVPAVIGALGLELSRPAGPGLDLLPAATGFLSAAAAGYLALVWLVKLLIKGRFHLFAPYCWLIGGTTLVIDYAGLSSG